MTQYHVTLNAQGYMLDLDRYEKRVREPFVPRQSQGSVAVEDLRGPEQVLVISDWSGGEGYEQHDPTHPSRYRSGTGIDGYTHPGTLRLGPYVTTVQTVTDNRIFALGVYGNKLYAGGSSGKIYTWDGTIWANPHTMAAGVLSFEVFLNKLYAGSTSGVAASFDGTTWTATAFTAGGGVDTLITHYREAAQYLYVACRSAGSGGVSRIYSWDGAALSLGQFDPEEVFPLAGAVLGQRCYFGTVDTNARMGGLYSVDDAGSGGTWRTHFRGDAHMGFAGAAVLGSVMYLGGYYDGTIWRWDGSELEMMRKLTQPGAAYAGVLGGLAAWGEALWVGVQESGGTLGLLRYDPSSGAGRAGWSRPVTGLAGGDVDCVQVYGGDLYVGTFQVGAAKVYRLSGSLYGGSGQLVSGLIDCGLPGVSKLLRSVTLVAAPMVSGHSVQVEYQLEDAGTWTSLGTLSAAGATTATYSFPASVTCRQVAFRLTLTGSAGASTSPVVYELAVRYVPRPAVAREWELACILEGSPELPLVTLDGEASPQTAAQLTSALWAAAGAPGPVTLVDLDGSTYSVYVQDVREEIGKLSQRRASSGGYQRVGLLELVEAT